MMTRRSFAGLAVGGTLALIGCGAAGLASFTASRVENSAASIAERTPTPPEPAVVATTAPVTKLASADANLPESIAAADPSAAGSSATAPPDVEPVSTDAAP